MKILNILLSIYTVLACKPACNINKLINDTERILDELDKQVSTEIQILDIEVKIAIVAETINFQKQIDEIFEKLSRRHLEQHNKYEIMLASIGLSPAREDEIYKIEEMERVAKKRNGIINSIYE
jgi:hypothetical protein